MARMIHEFKKEIEDAQGGRYKVFVYGSQRTDGLWEGWLEFYPEHHPGPALVTGRETTQPNYKALKYWSTGLEYTYLLNALQMRAGVDCFLLEQRGEHTHLLNTLRARIPGVDYAQEALLIHRYSVPVSDALGRGYSVRAYGQSRPDGTWEGWLEFYPVEQEEPILCTGRETSQPDKKALVYWAGGLEPVYLEGALKRARRGHQVRHSEVASPC